MTSHDVVAALRRMTGQKCGHTGTLDPAAEGVLPICLGSATKLAQIMSDSDKAYRVEIIFGAETDTQDYTGNIVKEGALEADYADVLAAVASFQGEYDQVPPMYSAVKLKGRKLYELAREGVEIPRHPRRVYFYSIEAMNLDIPRRGELLVRCSKGAYMRTLCEDIGRKLGACAHMGKLLRTESGGFTLDEAFTLDKLAAEPSRALIPIEKIPALRHLPRLTVPSSWDKRLLSGGFLWASDIPGAPSLHTDERALIYTSNGRLSAIYKAELDETGTNLRLRPFIMLV